MRASKWRGEEENLKETVRNKLFWKRNGPFFQAGEGDLATDRLRVERLTCAAPQELNRSRRFTWAPVTRRIHIPRLGKDQLFHHETDLLGGNPKDCFSFARPNRSSMFAAL